MAPDTAAVAAFLRERQQATRVDWNADREALWAAVKAGRWDPLTAAAASTALRAWHDLGQHGRGGAGEVAR